MGRVYYPVMDTGRYGKIRGDWPHSRIVGDRGGYVVQRKGEPWTPLGWFNRLRSYTEYCGEPLFTAERAGGLCVGYGDQVHEVGDALDPAIGIVAGDVFCQTRFEDEWLLAWGSVTKARLGERIIRHTVDIHPHADRSGFDIGYIARLANGRLIAVWNENPSRPFDRIAYFQMVDGLRIVAGAHITPFASPYIETEQNWYVDIGEQTYGPYACAEGLELDRRVGLVHFRNEPDSQERLSLPLAA